MKLGKCKQALADLINANGGWVDGEAIFAAMDGNGDLFGYSGRPQWTVSHGHWYGHTLTCWFFSPIVINNHHQTILSCEEYYQAYPKADADGWIEWNGGDCTVGEGDRIDVKFSDGDEFFDVGSDWDWGVDAGGCNIIAYRLHKQADPEFCESVTRAIPEPDEQVWTNPPSIEQLAADYRNAKDYAERKQQEADAAKADADSKLKALVIAGEALGLLVSPITAKQESELVSEVKVGDEVECVESNVYREKYRGMIGTVLEVDDSSTPYLVDFGGEKRIWCHEVKFISRP